MVSGCPQANGMSDCSESRGPRVTKTDVQARFDNSVFIIHNSSGMFHPGNAVDGGDEDLPAMAL